MLNANNIKLFESFMKYNKKLKKPSKLLKEDAANDADEPKLYMNTWKNYNINGADTDSIKGGWMNIEQAKEFLEVHNEEEPFINDTDNVPFEVDEYSNPRQVIEQLEQIEEVDNKDAFLAILEDQNYNFESALDIYNSGDFTFFAGVDNDFDLGKAYVDMVGLSNINNIENYVNREYVKQNLINNLDSEEDLSDDTIEAMVDEEIEVAKVDNDEGFFENYFDYESLGRDLDFEGYTFTDYGAIQVS